MFQLSPFTATATQHGLTMIELLVTVSIIGIMLAVGIPNASHWLLANRARAASEFYADGFSLARRQAIAHNSHSRISLTPNVTTGQMDWQVDICFTTPDARCTDAAGAWSTTAAASAA
ncbi:pilus assembly FimT family protein, partial [Duganella phyllosphaerae]|uniref:pilus assembly FimT family protein n=1 Tax=Duganella phyllosphaerae TaxID=762836 RepID=UPI000B009424